MQDEMKRICRTPTIGRDGQTKIPNWKYECVRRAILDEIKGRETGQIRFKDLADAVAVRLTSNQLSKLGSLKWHVTTVKLNMEVEGELKRVLGARPQALMQGDGNAALDR